MTVSQAISEIFNDIDSENEPEIDEIEPENDEARFVNNIIRQNVDENVNIDDNVAAREGRVFENVINELQFNWELSGFEDPYDASWLREFDMRPNRTGILVNTDDLMPLDYFKLFFPDELFECIADNTNLYAEQFFDSPSYDELPVNSRFRKWQATSPNEMKKYVALQIAMGICSKPEIAEYWDKFWLTNVRFGKVMSRNRFELLSSFIHFNDNSSQIPRGQPGYDPLHKVRPLLDITDPLYLAAYAPKRELAIDESMIKFKGRIFFRQYLPAKPTKWGIKQFALCESDSGYALRFLLYTGKTTFEVDRAMGLADQVVTKLVEGFENKGHRLYTDNFYTSPLLCKKLESEQIGLCGTVKPNRKFFPKDLQPASLKLVKGDDPVFMRSDNTIACAWHDTKRVHFLSTIHNNLTLDKRLRSKQSEDGYRNVEKPVMAEDYNKYMNGVDKLDQLLGTYAYPHKCAKWYHTIYHRIREVAIVNGYILYKKTLEKEKRNGPLIFREEIIHGLLLEGGIDEATPNRRTGRCSEAAPGRLTERHFLGIYPDPKHKPDCYVCSDRHRRGWKRKQTRYHCKQCQVAVCPTPCMEILHTKLDFKQAAAEIVYQM